MGKATYSRIVMNYSETINKGDWNDIKARRKMVGVVYTKMYNEAVMKVCALSPCAKLLLFFLADRMDDRGVIYSNKDVREEFATYSTDALEGRGYTDGTIVIAFTELRKKEFLIEMGRGVMWINPIYIWRGDEESRVQALQRIFKDKYQNLKVILEK